jgi:hypothetical protein
LLLLGELHSIVEVKSVAQGRIKWNSPAFLRDTVRQLLRGGLRRNSNTNDRSEYMLERYDSSYLGYCDKGKTLAEMRQRTLIAIQPIANKNYIISAA